MASAPEPEVRPVRSAPPAATGGVPPIAWPLVERRHPRATGRVGPDRRADGRQSATGRLSQSVPPPLAPFRWVAIGVGLIVAYPDLHVTSYRLMLGAIVLIAYAAGRTWRPI